MAALGDSDRAFETVMDKLRVPNERPLPVEWWKTIDELLEELGISESTLRRRVSALKRSGTKIEKRLVRGVAYYNVHTPWSK